MQTRPTYRWLQSEKRLTTASMRQSRSSVRAMARTLGRLPATISRELARNATTEGDYGSLHAYALCQVQRIQAGSAPKPHCEYVLLGIVLTMLDWKWSPQQIAGILRRVWPQDPNMHVSHEKSYTAIYAHTRAELRGQIL